jgi:hypothetical protein
MNFSRYFGTVSALARMSKARSFSNRTPGLDVRLKLTDEIVRSVLPPRPARSGSHDHPSVEAWKAVAAKFEPLLFVRRRLAHHPVEARWSLLEPVAPAAGPLNKPIPVGVGYEVRTGEHERKRRRNSIAPPLSIQDLRDHLSAVRVLANELNEFNRDAFAQQLEELARIKGQQT